MKAASQRQSFLRRLGIAILFLEVPVLLIVLLIQLGAHPLSSGDFVLVGVTALVIVAGALGWWFGRLGGWKQVAAIILACLVAIYPLMTLTAMPGRLVKQAMRQK